MGILNQIIRGHVYGYSSIEIAIDGGKLFSSVQSIDYNFERNIGVLRGNGSAMKKGRTRGEFDFKGSISMAKGDDTEFIAILAALGMGGFAEAVFDIIVTYSELGQGVPVVDTLVGCTITNGADSHSVGPDPLVKTYELDMMDILYNGLSPASVAGGGGGISSIIGGLIP
jgi:hypothetical protein